jgi:hypothetical protein
MLQKSSSYSPQSMLIGMRWFVPRDDPMDHHRTLKSSFWPSLSKDKKVDGKTSRFLLRRRNDQQLRKVPKEVLHCVLLYVLDSQLQKAYNDIILVMG